MIVCIGVPPWIVLDLLQWKTQCLFTYIRSGSVSHYFPVGSQKLSSMNKSWGKNPTAHSQNMLHVDVLYTIKRKKYKTVCAELAFTKSPSTEWSWFCIKLIIHFLYLLDSWIIAYSKSVWSKVGTLTVYIDIK